MTKLRSLGTGNNIYSRSILVLSLLLIVTRLDAQTPVNFSGVWTLDNAKSDASYKEYRVTCTVKQTADSITIGEIFLAKNGEKTTMPEYTYTFDGKETSKEEQGGIDRKSARWSSDKKVLTAKNTRTVGANIYGSYTTYKLSDDGRVLTVQTTDIDPSKKTSLIEVFNRKE